MWIDQKVIYDIINNFDCFHLLSVWVNQFTLPKILAIPCTKEQKTKYQKGFLGYWHFSWPHLANTLGTPMVLVKQLFHRLTNFVCMNVLKLHKTVSIPFLRLFVFDLKNNNLGASQMFWAVYNSLLFSALNQNNDQNYEVSTSKF